MVQLQSTTVRANAFGAVRLMFRVSCDADGPVNGTVTARIGRKKVGSAAFTFVPGTTDSMRLLLTDGGFEQLLLRKRVRLSLTINVRDGSGADFLTRTVVVMTPKPTRMRLGMSRHTLRR